MAEKLKTETFVVSYVKRKSFRVIGQSVGVSASPVVLVEVAWIPRLGTITPLELDITYGTADPDVTSTMEFYMTLVDVNNLPLIEAVAERSIWGTMVNWVVHDLTGVIQTMMRDTADFFHPASFSYSELADFTQRSVVAILANTEVNTQEATVIGVCYFAVDLIQRVFGSDSATFNESDSKWIDDFADEEEADYDD